MFENVMKCILVQAINNIMKAQQSEHIENAYDYFAAVPKEQRAKFYEEVFAKKQKESPPQKVFQKEYPSFSSFNYKGYKIHYYKIQNSESPRAIFIHFHGFRSHGGVTGYYADIIAKHNPQTNLYAFDQINFGRSQGPCHGLIPPLQESVQQGEAFVDHLLAQFQGKVKVFLSGSSYGGTIIFKMALKKPQKYSGLIFLSPALRDLTISQYIMKKVGRLLGWMAPRMHLPFPLKSKDSTKFNCDQLLNDDPYYEKTLVPGSVSAVLNSLEEVSKLYGELSVPYLLMQSGVDKSIDLFAPIDLEKESPSKDKETFYYKDMWHSVFYEEQIEDISRRVALWVQKRI